MSTSSRPASKPEWTNQRLAVAALTAITDPGDMSVWKVAAEHGPVAAVEALCDDGPRDHTTTSDAHLDRRHADAVASQLAERADATGVRLITPYDPEWPVAINDIARLRDTAPPIGLWLKGPHHLAELTTRAIAVIGSRAATAYGTGTASRLAFDLAAAGHTVTSGGAFGIDAAAHRSALEPDNSPGTIAVLACGVDIAYPSAHQRLFDRIATEGILLSPYPLGTRPARHQFPYRNHITAALAAATVVVEAGPRSGTSHTARTAHQLGRLVAAVPGPITSAASLGTHRLLRDLPGTRPVTSAIDILTDLAATHH